MIIPSNNLALLGIGASHRTRLELADQLFFPVLVDIKNPSQPMPGGYVGNRGGASQRLTSPGIGGNTGGYGADFSELEGDPITAVKTMTSDGPVFTMQKYDGSGIITVEDPLLNGDGTPAADDFSNVPRYIVKSDGIVYDLLELRGAEPPPNAGFANGPYRHWELAAAAPGAGYTAATNTYNPPISSADITEDHYTRPVGLISFRDKQGASSSAIQEQLQRAQSTLDTMSRLLRSLQQESQTAFANIVVR